MDYLSLSVGCGFAFCGVVCCVLLCVGVLLFVFVWLCVVGVVFLLLLVFLCVW